MDKLVDVFMHDNKIFVFITSTHMNRQLVVAMDFIKPQFFSCNRTSPILRRIERNSVIHILDASACFFHTHQRKHDCSVDTKILWISALPSSVYLHTFFFLYKGVFVWIYPTGATVLLLINRICLLSP